MTKLLAVMWWVTAIALLVLSVEATCQDAPAAPSEMRAVTMTRMARICEYWVWDGKPQAFCHVLQTPAEAEASFAQMHDLSLLVEYVIEYQMVPDSEMPVVVGDPLPDAPSARSAGEMHQDSGWLDMQLEVPRKIKFWSGRRWSEPPLRSSKDVFLDPLFLGATAGQVFATWYDIRVTEDAHSRCPWIGEADNFGKFPSTGQLWRHEAPALIGSVALQYVFGRFVWKPLEPVMPAAMIATHIHGAARWHQVCP